MIRRQRFVKEFLNPYDRLLELSEQEKIVYTKDTKNRYAILLGLIPPDPNLKILDVGAGWGLFTFLLKKWCNCDVRALDIEVRPKGIVEREGIKIEKCDIENERFPFDDCTFDYVVCGEVLEHLFSSPFHMLDEIRRVLKVGGILLLSTPNAVKLSIFAKLKLDIYSIPGNP